MTCFSWVYKFNVINLTTVSLLGSLNGNYDVKGCFETVNDVRLDLSKTCPICWIGHSFAATRDRLTFALWSFEEVSITICYSDFEFDLLATVD